MQRHSVPPVFRGLGWALLALQLPLHLALVALSLQAIELPGCGAGSACSRLMASPRASIAGWPISFLGFAVLIGTALTWATVRNHGNSRFLRYLARLSALAALGWLAILVTSQTICWYCVAVHVLTIAFWLVVELSPGRTKSMVRPAMAFVVGFSVPSAVLVVVRAEQRWSLQEAAHETPQRAQPALATGYQTSDQQPPRGIPRGHYTQGREEAPFHVVLFSDYSCAFCAEVEQQLRTIVRRNPDVSISLKHYPLCTDCNAAAGTNLHPNACRAASAAEAAGILAGTEGFWRMHEWLFHRKGEFTDDELREALTELQLPEELPRVMSSAETSRRIQADIKEARALRVDGTPTLYANGVRVRYWETDADLEREIVSLGRKASGTPAR